jgi:hypothetical protein
MIKRCKRCVKVKSTGLFNYHFSICKMCAKVHMDHGKALKMNEEYDKKWANVIQTHTAWKNGINVARNEAWNTVFRKSEQNT